MAPAFALCAIPSIVEIDDIVFSETSRLFPFSDSPTRRAGVGSLRQLDRITQLRIRASIPRFLILNPFTYLFRLRRLGEIGEFPIFAYYAKDLPVEIR